MRTLAAILVSLIPLGISAQGIGIRGFCDFSYGWSLNPQGPSLSGSNLEKIVVGKNFDRGVSITTHLGIYFTDIEKPAAFGLAARYSGALYFSAFNQTTRLVQNAFPDLSFNVVERDWYLGNLQMGAIVVRQKNNWAIDAAVFFGRSALHVPFLVIDGKKENKHYAYIRRLPDQIYFRSISPVIGVKRSFPDNVYIFARAELNMGIVLKQQFLSYEVFPDKESFEASTPSNWAAINNYYLPAITLGVGGWVR